MRSKSIARVFSLLIPICATATAFLVSGCALVDTFNPRANTMNQAITTYRNDATLLNIIRARYNEPLNFVALTGATGHSSLGASEGLPTVTFGPDVPVITATTKPTRNYSFGPNAITESSTVDFNVSLLDDPQSYGALMTALDPATIGFFTIRSFRQNILLPLFINEIRIIPINSSQSYSFFSNQFDTSLIVCTDNGVNPDDVSDRRSFFECGRTRIKVSDRPPKEKFAELAAKCAPPYVCVSPFTIIVTYLIDRGIQFQVPAG